MPTESIAATKKKCTACLEEKLLAGFYVCGGRYKSQCKQCITDAKRARYAIDPTAEKAAMLKYRSKHREEARERSRLWRNEDPERARQLALRYRMKHRGEARTKTQQWRAEDPERSRSSRKKWKRKNHTKVIAASRRYYAKNKDKIRIRKVAWGKSNKDKSISYANTRRARKLGAEGAHSDADIKAIWERQKHKCAMPNCEYKIAAAGSNKYHVDHIHPLVRGGSNWPDNLQILCKTHNHQKCAADPYEWAQRHGRLFL
jgi:HNH endonuclease